MPKQLVHRARTERAAAATPRTRRKPVARKRAARKPVLPQRKRAGARPDPERVAALIAILARTYPDARCALDFQTPFQLLVATILSAQCTDVRVNQVTPGLFARYPDPQAFAGADKDELEARIRPTGFFRNKAKALRACSADIVARHGGEVPRTLDELTRLHGVGRKTANVVLGNAYGIPGVVVDTHVGRLSKRLGLTRHTDPVKIERDLMAIVPEERWTVFSHWLILHGRQICVARKPRCTICPLLPHCPRVGVTSFA